MQSKNEKKLDIELLIFYLGVSIISFVLYIIRHPILLLWNNNLNVKALISAYLVDLIIFMSVFFPYIILIIVLLILKLYREVSIKDNVYVILFFPILSFFAKGMSLLQVYIYSDFWEILKDNFGFFSFLFIGPLIVILNKILINIHKRMIEGNK